MLKVFITNTSYVLCKRLYEPMSRKSNNRVSVNLAQLPTAFLIVLQHQVTKILISQPGGCIARVRSRQHEGNGGNSLPFSVHCVTESLVSDYG